MNLPPLLLVALFATNAAWSSVHPTQVSENGRFLETSDGQPYFWLADTAWSLFHHLDREEATVYLEKRSEQGFNVVMAVALAEPDGLRTENAYGELPLHDLDPSRPNEAYFEHIDFVVAKANELGITIGLLPTWGDKFNLKWGVGPEVFDPQNAFDYGQFIGSRYADTSVVWILGGDRSPESQAHLDIIHAMARGIQAGDHRGHLMTYHPQGHRSSSLYFHESDWLDFNLHQSGHGNVDFANYKATLRDYALVPTKPAMDGEPCYEDHPVNWKPELGWFDEFDARRAGYWSILSGASGHAYGHHSVWQMWEPGREPISSARTLWQEAIDYPGARQLGYLRKAFESIPWYDLSPKSELLVSGPSTGANAVLVAASPDHSTVLAYTPHGESFTIQLPGIKTSKIDAQWFNPRDGDSQSFEPRTPQVTNLWEFNPPFGTGTRQRLASHPRCTLNRGRNDADTALQLYLTPLAISRPLGAIDIKSNHSPGR
ncbi:DUF4038 domain-containing protein [Pelagicoccus sp. SDUM812002]|uniref:apiosidase-like domain-containing protein n=1 Tax=Pelagicoccus sp. SDUM812002 TaxID=3041266 RepID=UPI00280D609E|nr:DUF4038 domain-containing protein [Pelagicoccus sp. SDUM812002]MDQ8186554.1 DUF4038 domain-containing protein [Pelagicoccus sp. SDUM812002]